MYMLEAPPGVRAIHHNEDAKNILAISIVNKRQTMQFLNSIGKQ